MEYVLRNATDDDILLLKEYKKNIIGEYASNLSESEINDINDYVERSVLQDLVNYRIILINNLMVGCYLLSNNDDGVLLDEIYIDEKFRNNGIGTKIIKEVIKANNVVYLWVYKLNVKAINLYKKLGFKIIGETESRFYMKYVK